MLNHTYTSVKNANLVDCGKKQHIPSQPSPLLKDNFLGEFRTELDKKKVLANLGIATDLSLEWENIKGDIGSNKDLMNTLDARTKYITQIGEFKGTVISVINGIEQLEKIVGGEQEGEDEQNNRLTALETLAQETETALDDLATYITTTVDVNVGKLQKDLADITAKVDNITSLIQVSAQAGNALTLLTEDNPGLYVPDLSGRIDSLSSDVGALQKDVQTVKDDYVKREEFGDGDLDFVSKSDYNSFSSNTDTRLDSLEDEIKNTVKTGEDGHVDTLFVNTISKDNDQGNIKITDSFEMESGIPLDIRFVVEDVQALCSLNVAVCYPGMAVVVKKLNSLYILKNPEEGVEFNQEYVSADKNWKCPEDLVTVALTRTQYDELVDAGSINESVFYYIYEEDTEEPKRSNFDSDEAYQEAYNAWLKILSQEYMSAAWGIDIETKLGQKASSADLNALNSNLKQVQDELADIKGGDADNSLASLGKSIETIHETTTELEGRLNQLVDVKEDGSEGGRIVVLEASVGTITKSLDDYVTKNELQDETQDFIFVKTSDYEKYKEELEDSITTGQITAESITATSLSLNSANIEVAEDHLKIEGKPIALSEDLMQVEVIDQDTYNQKEQAGELSNNVYYYTYDGNVSLVTNDELNSVKEELKALNSLVVQLQKDIAALQQIVQGSNQTE